MTAAEAAGPGRRLTDAEEQQAAELFAAGQSTRAVAAALGIGNGTAARLKQRLAARSASAGTSPEDTVTEHDEHQDDPGDDGLAALQLERDAQAEHVEGLRQREAVSRQAAAELDAERLRGLADGIADPALRQRIANAQADAADWSTAAELAQAKLAGIDEQIAAVEARRELTAMRAELAAAVAGRDAVCAATGERQRICVQAVRAAAEGFCLAMADEREAIERAEQLAVTVAARSAALGEPAPVVPPAVSTGLWVSPESGWGPPVALLRAINQAREGHAQAVAVQLGEAFGYLPPDPAELAAERDRMLAMAAERDRAEQEHRQHLAPQPQVRHLPEHLGASVSVDAAGNPLRPPDPDRPRPQQVVRPGALGFQPWPG